MDFNHRGIQPPYPLHRRTKELPPNKYRLFNGNLWSYWFKSRIIFLRRGEACETKTTRCNGKEKNRRTEKNRRSGNDHALGFSVGRRIHVRVRLERFSTVRSLDFLSVRGVRNVQHLMLVWRHITRGHFEEKKNIYAKDKERCNPPVALRHAPLFSRWGIHQRCSRKDSGGSKDGWLGRRMGARGPPLPTCLHLLLQWNSYAGDIMTNYSRCVPHI